MMILSFGKKFPQALSQINVLIIGSTGVGKSTLISTLFDKLISDEITEKISDKSYTKPGSSIAVYDSRGLVKDKKQSDETKKKIEKFIKQQNQKEPSDQIHAVWYCVNSQANRPTEIDSDWIGSITKELQLPVLAVITRSCGIEEGWLQPYLESVQHIRRVVPVLARKENLRGQPIEPYGLDRLLSATEDLLEEIAQRAIANAVKAKADKAFAWCRDGSAKVLATQVVGHIVPVVKLVPGVKYSAGLLQTQMLMDISKEFGYQFNRNELSDFCKMIAVTVGAATGFEALDLLLKDKLSSLPGIDYNNIQTVKDIMSHITSSLDHVTGILPFKDQLLGILTDISNSHWIGALPILNCITATATTLSTGFLAIAYIETLKECKQAEYEGQPMPDVKKEFAKKVKQMMELIRQFTEPSWLPNLSG